MLTIKQGLKLSAIIDKMDLKISNPSGTQEEVGADLMLQMVRKAHKAEMEIYTLIADVKKIPINEVANVDFIAFVTELFSDPGVAGFFKSAVGSKDRE